MKKIIFLIFGLALSGCSNLTCDYSIHYNPSTKRYHIWTCGFLGQLLESFERETDAVEKVKEYRKNGVPESKKSRYIYVPKD